MSTHYVAKAIVFKKEDRAEADRLFTVFTREFGRIEILGRAIRKITSKLRGGLEIFSLSDIEFVQGRNRKTLIDAVLVERYKHIAQSPEKMEIAEQVCDALSVFIKGQESDNIIWDLVIDFFEKLNSASLEFLNWQLVYHYFFWNLISSLGYKPELFMCVICNRALNSLSLYFSFSDGGLVCNDCYFIKKVGFKIQADSVKVLRIMLKKDWEIMLRLKIKTDCQKDLQKIFENYHQYLLSVYF